MTPQQVIELEGKATAKIGCPECNDVTMVWSDLYNDDLPCLSCRPARERKAHAIADFTIAARDTAPDLARRLLAIEALARQYNSPAVNPGAHELAGKVLRLLEERT